MNQFGAWWRRISLLGTVRALPWRASAKNRSAHQRRPQLATSHWPLATILLLVLSVSVQAQTAPSFGSAAIADQSYTATAPIAFLHLPTASGITPLTYTLSGDLPVGLRFEVDGNLPALSGTPEVATANTQLVYTVTDSSRAKQTDSLTFNIYVAAPPMLPSLEDLTFSANFSVQNLPNPPTLPEIIGGGIAPIRYFLNGRLPSLFYFDADSRTLKRSAQRPTEAPVALTFGAIDKNGVVGTSTFRLHTNPQLMFTQLPGAGHVRSSEIYSVDRTTLALEPALTLPAFSGGTGSLTGALEGPGDLGGLTFDPVSRVLSGALRSLSSGGYYSWTVTDDSGAFIRLIFIIRTSGPYFRDLQADLIFVQGEKSRAELQVASTGGRPTYAEVSYTLLDATGAVVSTVLPGLRFNPNVHPPSITGTPTTGIKPIALTYSVRDSRGSGDNLVFNVGVTVDPLIFASDANIADQSYTATRVIPALQLPTASGGVAPLRYTLSGGLPAGLRYIGDSDPPTISGTPDAATANTQLLYTVTDSSTVPLTTTLRFNVHIAAPPVLSSGDLTYTAGFPLENLPTPPTLPATTSGVAPVSYAVVGLPAGLAFDPASRTLKGAAEAAGSSSLSYTATDSNNAVATAIFPLTIEEPITFAEQDGAGHVRNGVRYRVDPSIRVLGPELTLPAFSGGSGSRTAVLTGPAGDSDLGGLDFNPTSRVLSGTLSEQTVGGNFVWTVSDSSGAVATLYFSVKSTGPYFEVTQADLRFVQGELSRVTLPAANTSQAEPDSSSVTYTLLDANGDPAAYALPDLSFADHSRVFSGVPRAGRNPTALTYTVLDGAGTSEALIFHVEVLPAPLLFASDASISDQSYTATAAIHTLQLPTATGGIAPLAYTLSSGLPAGLSLAFERNRPVLRGTPEAALANTQLVYTVTDAAIVPQTATLSFNIYVAAPPMLSQGDLRFSAGFGVQNLHVPATLSEITGGGIASIKYFLNGLPSGINFYPASRTLRGAPRLTPEAPFELTYGAIDSNGAVGTVTFTLHINPQIAFIQRRGEGHVHRHEVYRVDPTTLALDSALTLPELGGGTGTLTGALKGPSGFDDLGGLVFDPVSRVLSGALRSRVSGGSYTWNAIDSSGAATTLFFSVRTSGPYFRGTQYDLTFAHGERGRAELSVGTTGDTRPAVASVSYSLVDATGAAVSTVLPGLNFDPNSHPPSISGTPATGGKKLIALTYTVSDRTGDGETLIFNVAITVKPLIFTGGANVADQSYTATAAIPPLRLPTATGGIAPLRYSFSSLPAGLSYAGDSAPLTLSGTPDAATENTQLVYTVTDSSTEPLTNTLRFNVYVAAPPVLSQDDLTYTAGFPLENLPIPPTLPEITSGGIAPFRYAVIDLPASLAFDPVSRTLKGAAEAAGSSSLRYTATDSKNAVGTAIFTLTIDEPITFAEQDGAGHVRNGVRYRVDPALRILEPELTLPAFSGGVGSLTAVLAGPAGDSDLGGLNFNPASRVLSGTLNEQTVGGNFAWTVSDSSGVIATLRFSIKSAGPYFAVPQADLTFVQGELGSVTLPEADTSQAEPDAASVTYSLLDAADNPAAHVLPGLDFTDHIRVFAGTPSAGKNPIALRYTVRDGAGTSETLVFNVAILPTPPRFASNANIPDQSYTATAAIHTLRPPTATGGIAPLTYSFGSGLPAGLRFAADEDPPILRGIPEAAVANTQLLYTVTDSSTVPLTDTLRFNVYVAAPLMLSQGDLSFSAVFGVQHLRIPPTLPEITGGGIAPIRYFLNGLPFGMNFSPARRTLRGSPRLTPEAPFELTFGAIDRNGAVGTTTFTLHINPQIFFINQRGDSHVRLNETYYVDPLTRTLLPALTLPAFGGGTGTLTGALTGPYDSSDLSGLTFDPVSRVLSGALRSGSFGGRFAWIATDSSGAYTPLHFNIGSIDPYFEDPQADLTFAQGEQGRVELPLASTRGARPDPTLSYTLLDATGAAVSTVLPGLRFDPNSNPPSISGTPTAGKNPIALRYTAIDANGNGKTLRFDVEVTPDPLGFASDANIADQSYTATAAITPLQLPIATGGITPLVYTLSGGLPAGLSFVGDSGPPAISGIPDAATANTQLVYTVTDSAIVPLNATLTLNVYVAAPPMLSQGNLSFTAGFPLEELPTPPTLPEITSGGVAPIRYAVAGLPANLVFDPASRTLTGAASAAGSSELRFTATDANTAVATAIFTLTMNEPLTFSEQIGDHHVRSGVLYRVDSITLSLDAALTLPAFGGGDESLTATLTGPAGDSDLGGLVFDPATRVLSGTLRSRDAGGYYVWTVGDSSGAYTTLRFAIRGAGPYFDATQSKLTFVQGEQGSATLPEANTTLAQPDAASVFYTLLDTNGASVATALPGLSFNTASRTLAGTSPLGKNPIALRYTATDGNGNSETLIFDVEITPDPLIFASGANIADQSYTATATVTTLELPTATGGITALVYTMSGGLPAGLSFVGDSDPPTLGGTPDAATANTQLVYAVTDSSIVPLTATLTFNVYVAAPPVLSQGNLTYTAGFSLEELPTPPTLPEVSSGGVAPIRYAAIGLPANLVFDPVSRALTGAASGVGSSELRFTATDANTAVATAIFTLTVNEPLTFSEQVGERHVRSGARYRVDSTSLSLDAALTLPAFGGGDEALTATLIGPAGDSDLGGLEFNPAPRTLSGKLRSRGAGGNYVWTVGDGSGAYNSLRFALRGAGPHFEATQEDLTFVQGEQSSATLLAADITEALPDEASVSYTLLEAAGTAVTTILPGIAFNAATRTLSGAPTAGKNPIALSYTTTDGESNSDTLVFHVSVTPLALQFADNIPDHSYIVNVPITTLSLPSARDGIAGYSYTLGGAPAGLIFNATANPPTLSGAPIDNTEGDYSLTFTVTDSAAGTPATASLTFAVNIVPLAFVPATVADQSFTIGTPATLSLPTTVGGNSPYSYTLEASPTELTFAANGGTPQDPPTLNGTPEDGSEGNYSLVYTVTDSSSPAHTLSLTFKLTIRQGTMHFNTLNRVLLPEVARAVADQNIGAITRRISYIRSDRKSKDATADNSQAAQANLGGQDSWAGLLHSHGLTLLKGEQLNGRDILSKSNFVLPLNTKHLRHDDPAEQHGMALSLWGSGSYRDISGDDGGVDWEGELIGAHLGLDTFISQQLLLGFAVSQNSSDLDYEIDNRTGAYQVDMTSLNPYFSWASEDERLEVWGTVGFGQGELEIDDDKVTDTASSDVNMSSLGGGISGPILGPVLNSSKLQIRLRGDALKASLEVEESAYIEYLEVNISRLRIALEATGVLILPGGAHLEPLLEMGLRHDGDDGAERNLLELGLGVRHRLPHLGLSLEGRVHLLTGDHYDEYGAHAALQLTPNPHKGLSLQLSSGYGADANPDINEIWQRDLQQNLSPTSPDSLRYNARLGFNIPTPTRRHHTLLTPYTEFTLDGPTSHTLGLNWQLPNASLQLEWSRKQEEAPEAEINARFRF